MRPPDNNSTAYSLVHDDVPVNDIEAPSVRPAPWGNNEEIRINEYNGIPIIGGSRLRNRDPPNSSAMDVNE